MHKKHIVIASGTTAVGAIVFIGLLRQSGDATGAIQPRVVNVHVADRCGNLVRESSGEPMIVQIQVDPPPLNDDTGAHQAAVEGLPLAEGFQVGFFRPVDPRKVSGSDISC